MNLDAVALNRPPLVFFEHSRCASVKCRHCHCPANRVLFCLRCIECRVNKKKTRQLLTANFEPLHRMVERQNCPVERAHNHHLKQGFLFGLAATHKQLASPTASASLSVLAAPASSPHVVAVYLTLSDSTDRWTDRGHSVRPSARRPPPRRGRWRPTFPSFTPSLVKRLRKPDR